MPWQSRHVALIAHCFRIIQKVFCANSVSATKVVHLHCALQIEPGSGEAEGVMVPALGLQLSDQSNGSERPGIHTVFREQHEKDVDSRGGGHELRECGLRTKQRNAVWHR